MLWIGAGIGAMSLGTGLVWLIAPRWRRRAAETEGRAARVVRARRRAGGLTTIIVDKGLDVPLSIPEAFAVWGRLDNLPRFVPHVRAVREVAVDRHRWELGRPGEPPIELDTRITRFGSHRVVAWETMPGSVVKHTGSIRLRPGAAGRARVALRLSYVLPPSPFGDQVAALVQADGIDDALRGWKASLERGSPGEVDDPALAPGAGGSCD